MTYSGCTVDTSLTIEYSNEEKDIKFTHALVKSEKVNADCEKDGMEAYWTCTSCQRRFSDEDGTKELNKPSRLFQRLDMITKWTRKNQRMAQE